MKKSIIAILTIVVLGLGAVFIFAQKGKMNRGGFAGFGGRGFERIAEKLNLSDEQQTQVKTILEDSKTRVKPLTDSLRESRKQAETLGIDGTFNEEQVNQIANSQSETMKQLFVEKEKTKAQIFAVLTPEQRAEAAKMKDQFKERFKDGFEKRRAGKQNAPATEE
ncbi:MAG TPA: Spy/CpxP family protein refolding chaperone [Pyrinomonadaceae bacterium]|jgi:protein CpxP